MTTSTLQDARDRDKCEPAKDYFSAHYPLVRSIVRSTIEAAMHRNGFDSQANPEGLEERIQNGISWAWKTYIEYVELAPSLHVALLAASRIGGRTHRPLGRNRRRGYVDAMDHAQNQSGAMDGIDYASDPDSDLRAADAEDAEERLIEGLPLRLRPYATLLLLGRRRCDIATQRGESRQTVGRRVAELGDWLQHLQQIQVRPFLHNFFP